MSDNEDFCYECDASTTWDEKEICSGCGRVWGYPLESTVLVEN